MIVKILKAWVVNIFFSREFDYFRILEESLMGDTVRDRWFDNCKMERSEMEI